MASVSSSVKVSVTFLIASIIMIMIGSLHCYINSFHFSLWCDHYSCTYIKNRRHDTKVTFLRDDFSGVTRVHVDPSKAHLDKDHTLEWDKELANYYYDKPSKYWHSIELYLKKSSISAEPHKILVVPNDLGAYAASTEMHKIQLYLDNHIDRLNIGHHHSITPIGIGMVITGVVICFLLLIFGMWTDAETKKENKRK